MQNARLGDIQRFFVAEIAVIAWWDGDAQLSTSILAGFDPALAETAAQDAYKPYDYVSFDVGINGYVIKTANRVNAVATGAPLAMAPTVGRWHASLAIAGLTPDDVETVFLTHMHGDHVGGLAEVTAQTPEPLFPHATFRHWALLNGAETPVVTSRRLKISKGKGW